MIQHGEIGPSGTLTGVVIRGGQTFVVDPAVGWPPHRPIRFGEMLRQALPQRGLHPDANAYRLRNLRNVQRGLREVAKMRAVRLRFPVMVGTLHGVVFRGNGDVLDLGLQGCQVVTDTGVGFIVDAWGGTTELETMRYHGYGTGSTAEAANQTGLVTELTTQYATDNVRPTGTLAENAANIFESVATLSPDATVALREHSLFSQAATGGGVMVDRTMYAEVSLTGGSDSYQTTYRCTLASGG